MGHVGPEHARGIAMWIYNGIILVVYLYMLWRCTDSGLERLILTFSVYGMFVDFGLQNPAKVGLLAWVVILFVKYRVIEDRRQQFIILFLLLYSSFFIFSAYGYHHDNIILILSQLSKVINPVLTYCLICAFIDRDPGLYTRYFNLFGYILVAQIGFSICKLIILGGFLEGWVGSLSGLDGGGAGTSLPLLSLFWLSLASRMRASNVRMWLFAAGMLLVGFAAAKRAVWLLFPALFGLLFLYFNRGKMVKAVIGAVVAMPVILYLGLRLSPTLNPEQQVWGSFDPVYAYKYVFSYSGGVDEESMVEGADEVQVGMGRIGAVLWVFVGDHTVSDNLIGKGVEYFVYADREDYSNAEYYQGISYRGAITGIVRQYMMLGWPNVFLLVSLLFSIYWRNRCALSTIAFAVFLFDFVFYNSVIIGNQFMFILFLFLMYSAKIEKLSVKTETT